MSLRHEGLNRFNKSHAAATSPFLEVARVFTRCNDVASGIQQPKQKRICKVAIPKNGHFGVFQLRENRDAGCAVHFYGNGGTKFLIKRGSQDHARVRRDPAWKIGGARLDKMQHLCA